jgi:hypothetical protein
MTSGAVWAVLRRPDLWLTALRQVVVLAPQRWWARAPFLPLPNKKYREMRATIQYGDPVHAFEPHDVVKYLSWCKTYGAA